MSNIEWPPQHSVLRGKVSNPCNPWDWVTDRVMGEVMPRLMLEFNSNKSPGTLDSTFPTILGLVAKWNENGGNLSKKKKVNVKKWIFYCQNVQDNKVIWSFWLFFKHFLRGVFGPTSKIPKKILFWKSVFFYFIYFYFFLLFNNLFQISYMQFL